MRHATRAGNQLELAIKRTASAGPAQGLAAQGLAALTNQQARQRQSSARESALESQQPGGCSGSSYQGRLLPSWMATSEEALQALRTHRAHWLGSEQSSESVLDVGLLSLERTDSEAAVVDSGLERVEGCFVGGHLRQSLPRPLSSPLAV